jgi:putative serine protease PepD
MGGRDDEEPDGADGDGADDPAPAPPDRFDLTDHLPDDLHLTLPDDLDDPLGEDLDDDLDDDHVAAARGGRPLPPDDRLWRHPSEIATAGLPDAALTPPPPRLSRRAARIARPVGYGQRLLAVGLSGVVGALLTASLLVATGRLSRVNVTVQPSSSTSSAVTTRASGPGGVAALVARVQSGIVSVQAAKAGTPAVHGSALIVGPGYAMTALRVVDQAAIVTLHIDGEPRPARVVGSDAETDLALLAFDGAAIEPPPLGTSSVLRPGDTAVSVAAPPTGAAGPTVTVGVVSAVDRTMLAGKNVLRGVLQIDQPIPAEGAGGALVDATGSVVGVTLPAADAATQIGYAIPIDAVSEVIRQLLQSGHVSRPWLGIEGGDTDLNAGAAVWGVKPSSPAARAGVQAGDVVTAVDGTSVKTMDGMLKVLRGHAPGDTVKLTIIRKGTTTDLMVTLAAK